MPPRVSTSSDDKAARDVWRDAESFSLVLGGPLYRLLCGAHLSDNVLQLVTRRLIVISLLTWLPLLVLCALEGHLVGRSVVPTFLEDIETHIRFLVVVPLLLIAELVVQQRLLPIARAFLEQKLIPETAMRRFDAAIVSASRLRNSTVAETLLIVFVYVVGVLLVWRRYTSLAPPTWYVTSSESGLKFSLAGLWYVYVSLPIFQFLLLRWYFRLFIWTRFLWQVSRIELSLVPTHPDRVGGLGFLSRTVYAFSVLLLAHGALVGGYIADRIFFAGAALPQFTEQIVVMVIVLLCIIFGPLFLFAPQLTRAKQAGFLEYSAFGARYVREFDAKWLGGARGNESPLGSGDIQSLADLANSFEVVRTMRPVPITKEAILQLALAVLLPLLPLLLTMMPLEALLQKLLGVVF